MTSLLCVCCFAAVLEPDTGLEHHRRSSSMRLSGTSYRSCIRERSLDDCIIGTHLGMGTPGKQLPTTRSGFYLSPATGAYLRFGDMIHFLKSERRNNKKSKREEKSSEALIVHMQLETFPEILPAE